MRKTTAVSVVMCALAACGEGSSKVTVHTGSTLVVAVDPRADGSWIRLPPMTDVTMDMGPRWMAASICGGDGEVDVAFEAYRRDDDDDVELPCRGDGSVPISVPVTVTGSTRADVRIGGGGGLVENGSGSVFASAGTWDLFARDLTSFSAPQRMVIERGVTADPNTPLAIDFTRDGFLAEARPVVAHGAIAAVSGQGYVALSGEGGTWAIVPRPFPAPPDAVMLPPADRLTAADEIEVHLAANDQTGAGQQVWKVVGAADPIEVTLPVPLVDASVALDGGRPTATWKAVAGWDRASLFAYYSDVSDPNNPSTLTWSYSDPEAAGADHLEFPDVTRILAWDPAWNLPATGDVSVDVSLSRATDDGWIKSSWGRAIAQP